MRERLGAPHPCACSHEAVGAQALLAPLSRFTSWGPGRESPGCGTGVNRVPQTSCPPRACDCGPPGNRIVAGGITGGPCPVQLVS